MGVAYATGDGINIFTSMNNFGQLWNVYTNARDLGRAVLAHFRIRTVGTRSIENCQPFRMRGNIAFAHNGTMFFGPYMTHDGKSDSHHFRDTVLNRIGTAIFSKRALDKTRAMVGYNKMAFMDKSGRFAFINEGQGIWVGDTWFSHRGFYLPDSYDADIRRTEGGSFCDVHNSPQTHATSNCPLIHEPGNNHKSNEIIEEGLKLNGEVICYNCLPDDVVDGDCEPLYSTDADKHCTKCAMYIDPYTNPYFARYRNIM